MPSETSSSKNGIFVIIIIIAVLVLLFLSGAFKNEKYNHPGGAEYDLQRFLPQKSGGGECDYWKNEIQNCCQNYQHPSNDKGQNLSNCATQWQYNCPSSGVKCTYSADGKHNNSCEGTTYCPAS